MDKKKYYEPPTMTVMVMETTCLLAGSNENSFSVGADESDDYDQIEKAVWD